MPAGELAHRITARELAEWAAFEQVTGPIDPRDRLDLAAARIAWVVAQALGVRGLRLEDLLPRWGEEAAQTPEEMIAIVRGIQRRQRGRSE